MMIKWEESESAWWWDITASESGQDQKQTKSSLGSLIWFSTTEWFSHKPQQSHWQGHTQTSPPLKRKLLEKCCQKMTKLSHLLQKHHVYTWYFKHVCWVAATTWTAVRWVTASVSVISVTISSLLNTWCWCWCSWWLIISQPTLISKSSLPTISSFKPFLL